MRKINSLLNERHPKRDDPLSALVTQVSSHLMLQQLWTTVAPKMLSQSSFVGQLNNELLTIYAHNASVATKIKLMSISLLTQLENLQKSNPYYKDCKVTGIRVKVQVKSQQKPILKSSRLLSNRAAIGLNQLADTLGDTALAYQLKQLAKKT